MTTEAEVDAAVRHLITTDPSALDPGSTLPITIDRIDISPALLSIHDRFHKKITAHYRTGSDQRVAQLWLKFRPSIDQVYPILNALDQAPGEQIFPKAFYAWKSPANDGAFIVTERVTGEALRDKLLKVSLLGRASELAVTFEANGVHMRRFHEASEASHGMPAAALSAALRQSVAESPRFTPAERAQVLSHVDRYSARLESAPDLPLRKVHHDWILRNIVIDAAGVDHIIDLDALRLPDDLRWYDPVYFLINLESQLKFSPLVRAASLAGLWRAFWGGYVGDGDIPDGLSSDQVVALFYLLRLQYLLGDSAHRPLDEMFTGPLGRRFVAKVRKTLIAGEASLILGM